MAGLTWKLARPRLATRLKALQPMKARAIGTPIARATQRPGVIRKAAGARGGLVIGVVIMAMSPFHPVPR